MALMNLFWGQKYEKQTSDLWAQGDGRRERVRCMERVTCKFILPCVK